MENILITGAAGFIGNKVCRVLLREGYNVVGLDNMNHYYDVQLKRWRLQDLSDQERFQFYEADIEDLQILRDIFNNYKFSAVINEAARAGVRYSMENPFVYLSTNATGTLNLLELCREKGIEKFVLASTSSLYAGQEMPFKESLAVNTPISPYAASKKAAEMMAYSYHYLYEMDISVLRYFTVYGPAGRPDMSIFRFIKWCLEGTPLTVYGDGSQERDFTFVDDVAWGTIKALKPVGFEIINLGNNTPHKLNRIIDMVEEYTGLNVKLNYEKFHKADMMATWADIDKAGELLGWKPLTPVEDGIKITVEWTLKNWNWLKDIKV